MNIEIIKRDPQQQKSSVTLLFVHGSGHAAWCFENYLEYFVDRGYPCRAVSLPGHGGSTGFDPEAIEFRTYVEAVLQVIEELDGEVVLLGHSLGGTIVQTIIAEHPDAVRGAVLIASGPASKQEIPGTGGKNALHAKALSMKELFTSDAPEMCERRARFSAMNKITSGNMPDDLEEIRNNTFFSGRISLEQSAKYRTLLQAEPQKPLADSKDLDLDLSKVDVPVLELTSRGDDLYSREVAELMAASLHAELVTLDDLCHDMMLDPAWETSAEAILRFLSKHF